MFRYCLIFLCFFSLCSYAATGAADKKKIPIDYHVDHPDHVPHHGGKNPIKKVGQDDVIFPRKRRKGEEEGE